MRDDDLSVALRSKRAGLEQRLLEEDATLVHVQTRLYVIEGVGDAIDTLKEVLVVDVWNE